MVNTPKDDSINKSKKVEFENHQNETHSMSEEEIKNQEKINEEISDEVESEKSKQKVEVDSLKWRLLKEKEENEWNLNIEKIFSMTPTEIYKRVSDFFEDRDIDSKINYIKEIQNDLKEKYSNDLKNQASINVVIDVLNYERKAKEMIAGGGPGYDINSFERRSDPMYNYAGNYYEKAFRLDTENKELKNKAIECYKKYAERESRYHPIPAGDYYEKAYKLSKTEEFKKKAIENYMKFVEKEEWWQPYSFVVDACIKAYELSVDEKIKLKAINILRRAVVNYIEFHNRLDNWAKAYYEKILKLDPENKAAAEGLKKTSSEISDEVELKNIVEWIKNEYQLTNEALKNKEFENYEDYENAERKFIFAFKSDSENEESKNDLIDFYEKQAEIGVKKGNYWKATRSYEKALKLDPENEELKNKFIDNINKFVEHDKKGDGIGIGIYDAVYIKRAFELDPKNEELRKKAIKINRKVADNYMELGYFSRSAEFYEKALELDPNNEEFREKAIESWEKQAEETIINKDLRAASNTYKKALKLDPENERIKEKLIKNHLNKADEYLFFANSIGGAVDECEEALKIDPENEEIKEKLRELKIR